MTYIIVLTALLFASDQQAPPAAPAPAPGSPAIYTSGEELLAALQKAIDRGWNDDRSRVEYGPIPDQPGPAREARRRPRACGQHRAALHHRGRRHAGHRRHH